jgi:Fic family protein
LRLGSEETDLLERANRAIGRLDGLTALIPDTSLFIYFYLRKEAVLSSQIEGTQSSLSDLLIYENEQLPGVPLDEVEEVSNYVAALNHGLDRLRGGFPLSLRLIREIHRVLLRSGRGSDKTPGEFRRSQNWVGGSRPGDALYVPPPHQEVSRCMGELEDFLQDRPRRTPTLVKAALAHAQFETIHPFLDGNGRVGRLMITFLLCAEQVMAEPILYLSLFFKQHRQEYYERLQRTRTEGEWEAWLRFFLRGVADSAGQAVTAARNIRDLFERDRARLQKLGSKAGTGLRVHEFMQRNPVFTIAKAAEVAGLSAPTVAARLQEMTDLGLVHELTGKKSWRLFAYSPFLALLNEGTELDR